MRDPRRVGVIGPLAEYRDGFAAELVGQGYTRECAARQLKLMAHLSRWLESRGLGSGDLTPERAEDFLGVRRAEGYILFSERALRPLLAYLRGLGVVGDPQPAACTPAGRLVEDYRRWLVSERGLADATVAAYLRTAELFLCRREQRGGLHLEGLTAGEVRGFVVEQCRCSYSPRVEGCCRWSTATPTRPSAPSHSKDGERQPAWCDAARQPGLSAGGSHGPVVNSWRSAASLSSPHLAAVDR